MRGDRRDRAGTSRSGDRFASAQADGARTRRASSSPPSQAVPSDRTRCAPGSNVLPADVELVAIHDAARPLVRPGDVARVVAAAARSGAALLAVPLRDTLKRVRDGRVVETPARDELWAAQTPQVFRTALLREALARAEADGFRGTDDAQLVERLGHARRDRRRRSRAT